MKETNYTTIHDTAFRLLQQQWDTITFAEILPINTAADFVTTAYILNDQTKAIGLDFLYGEDCSGQLIISFIYNRNKVVCINGNIKRWVKADDSEDTICLYESLEDDLSTIISLMNFTYLLAVTEA